MTNQLFMDMLFTLRSGWSGFAFYWLLFMIVAIVEVVRPSQRPRANLGDRISVNLGLGLLIAILQMLPFFSAYGAALLSIEYGFGALHLLDMPFWLSCLIGFLLLDFSGYVFHRGSHEIPMLWRLHRVHHSDQAVDASTTFRSHPLSVILIIAYDFSFVFLIGIEPAAVLVYAVSKMVIMWLSHADVKPAPRASAFFAMLVVTPAFHHRHHSAKQTQTDSNYGEVLTIWDHLFYSLSSLDGAVARYGLGDSYDREATNLLSQLKLPFKSL